MIRIQMDDIKRIQTDARPQVSGTVDSLDSKRYPQSAGRRHTRQRELNQIDQLMRQPGSLATEPAAIPLHKMGAARRDLDHPLGHQ